MDEQLLEEQGRMVTDIITNTTRRAIQEKSKPKPKKKRGQPKNVKSKSFHEEAPISEYMASVQNKRKKDKAKLKSLGLLQKPLPALKSMAQKEMTPKRTQKKGSIQTKSTLVHKENTPKRSPRK